MVGEAVLAQRLPQVLRRIQLRAVGRQQHHFHVRGNDQFASDVPARLVHHHQDELVSMALRNLGQEHRHRLGIDPGQYQTVHHAVMWAHGAKGVDVLTLQSGAHHWTQAPRRPAPPGRVEQPEASLVLEHQPHRAAALSLARDLSPHQAAQFF